MPYDDRHGGIAMPKQTRFIAETDDAGKVLWLWRLGYGERMPRPVQRLSALELELNQSTLDGASVDAVMEWLVKENIKRQALSGAVVKANFGSDKNIAATSPDMIDR